MSDKQTKNLYQIQSLMAAAIMRPLVNDGMQKLWVDGSETNKYAAGFIKPNQKLTSFERLEIYNQQYWYRLLESLQDDFPGLNAILGHKRFEKLVTAYITCYPSRSNSLNYLGENLPAFIKEEPHLTAPNLDLAYDMACFEWAEIKAFDTKAESVLNVETLNQTSPAEIVLKLQPYLSVLELKYAVDRFLLDLNKSHNKGVESNAITSRTVRFDKAANVKKQRIYVVIHRFNNFVYYKRIDKDQYFLLTLLSENKSLAEACNLLMSSKGERLDQERLGENIKKYFATWMELDWFCQIDA